MHALKQAHRVLKPDGILIDLRPAPKHRRVGIGEGKQWKSVGAMREKFDEDRAANRAVAQVLREGLFQTKGRVEFDLDRQMDTLEDLRAWMDEFVQEARIESHDWLVARVERALLKQPKGMKIAARGPLILRVMKKMQPLFPRHPAGQ